MPASPIQLDRILTWSYRFDTAESFEDPSNYVDRTKKVWARRDDFKTGSERPIVGIVGNKLVCQFTCRLSAFDVDRGVGRSRGLQTGTEYLIEASGTRWSISDFGEVVDSFGGSRPGYVKIICSRIA